MKVLFFLIAVLVIPLQASAVQRIYCDPTTDLALGILGPSDPDRANMATAPDDTVDANTVKKYRCSGGSLVLRPLGDRAKEFPDEWLAVFESQVDAWDGLTMAELRQILKLIIRRQIALEEAVRKRLP